MLAGNNRRNTILAGVVTVRDRHFYLSTVGTRPETLTARLVSTTAMSEVGDLCYRPVSADKQETNLFDSFELTAHAEDTLDVTRPPVRTIKDTYPIYSSIAVDPVRNEIILQDTKPVRYQNLQPDRQYPANVRSPLRRSA